MTFAMEFDKKDAEMGTFRKYRFAFNSFSSQFRIFGLGASYSRESSI